MFDSRILGDFILCYLTIYNTLAEPQCSRFPYEEALLEKMVRLEFKVEQMDNGFRSLQSKIQDELTRLQEQRDGITSTTKAMKNEIKTQTELMNSDFVKLMKERKQKGEEIEEKISDLIANANEEIGQLKNEVLRIGNENFEQNEAKFSRMSADLQNMLNSTRQYDKGEQDKQSIFFRASSPRDRDPEGNEKIIFTDLLDNQGDGYDKTTGIFTAPVDGNYLFSCQVCGKDNHDIRIGFVQDGTDKQPLQSKDDSNFSCGTAIFITQLDAGSEVWIKSLHAHSSGVFYKDATMRSIFSGVFLN